MDMPAAPMPPGNSAVPAGSGVAAQPGRGVAGREDAGHEGAAEPGEHHASGFFNLPWVQNVLPLASSLMLHISIITVGWMVFYGTSAVQNPNREQVIIRQTASLAKSATPGGVKHAGPPADPTRDVAQDRTKATDDKGFSDAAGNKLAAAGGPSGAASSFGLGEQSAAGGHGKPFGAGDGGGGTAPWGMPGGGDGMLPKSDFMGTGGNADDIVFLCDASGSMNIVSGALKTELKRSINQMSVDENGAQKFNVIFFGDGNVDALFRNGMRLATPDAKAKATEFIENQTTAGGTNPVPAIKFAMAERPQLLYVLTDGFDNVADLQAIVALFKGLNRDGKTHINTIFLQGDDPDPKLQEALKQIAHDGNGAFLPKLKSDM
jgi:hypothetical protein